MAKSNKGNQQAKSEATAVAQAVKEVAQEKGLPNLSPEQQRAIKDGVAVASMLIQKAEETGQMEQAYRGFNKDTLRRIAGWGADKVKHTAFRGHIAERLKATKARAEEAGKSLNEWCDDSPVDASIRVMCSVWTMLSEKVELGFVPDFNQPWQTGILSAARAWKQAASDGTTPPAGGSGTRQGQGGRPPRSLVDKASDFAKNHIRPAMDAAVKEGKPVTEATIPLWDAIATLMGNADLATWDVIIAKMTEQRNKLATAADDAAKVTAMAAKSSAEKVKGANMAPAKEKEPAPTAKGGKEKAKA